MPSIAVTTSPGFVALPPGIFSVHGAIAVTLISGLIAEMASIAAITDAAPVISAFIASIPGAGLILMPPVSNVIPLPTRARSKPGSASFPR